MEIRIKVFRKFGSAEANKTLAGGREQLSKKAIESKQSINSALNSDRSACRKVLDNSAQFQRLQISEHLRTWLLTGVKRAAL